MICNNCGFEIEIRDGVWYHKNHCCPDKAYYCEHPYSWYKKNNVISKPRGILRVMNIEEITDAPNDKELHKV